MKKILMLIISTIFSLSLICGCNIGPKRYEYGDFICFERSECVYLYALSEQGKEKEVIIVPDTIYGKEVRKISYSYGMSTGNGYIESNNLKAFYVTGVPTPYCKKKSTFDGSPNLNRIVLLEARKWADEQDDSLGPYLISDYYCYPSDKTYIPSFNCNDIDNPNNLFNYANVSYFYNYEGAENEGYCWVDNFAYGTKIEYIPDNPAREDYIFGGWYKEPECVNIWDFEKDTLPEQVLTDDGEEKYQETRLYAKWYKK